MSPTEPLPAPEGWVWRYRDRHNLTRSTVDTRHLLADGGTALRPWCGRPRVSLPTQWRGADPRTAAHLASLPACRRCLAMADRYGGDGGAP